MDKDQLKKEVIERHANGEFVKNIAADLGIYRALAYKILNEAGAQLMGRSRAAKMNPNLYRKGRMAACDILKEMTQEERLRALIAVANTHRRLMLRKNQQAG